MSNEDKPAVEQEKLVQAWKSNLPTFLNPGDEAVVRADEANPSGLRIHIGTVGRTGYSFDFNCSYVDDREVKVELSDVAKDGISVDEHQETVQQLAEDYVRHMHECAQSLHELTTQG
jgi:uncharacterized protein YjdB